jgi:hypothetical protein
MRRYFLGGIEEKAVDRIGRRRASLWLKVGSLPKSDLELPSLALPEKALRHDPAGSARSWPAKKARYEVPLEQEQIGNQASVESTGIDNAHAKNRTVRVNHNRW